MVIFIYEMYLFTVLLTVCFIVIAEAGYMDQDYKLFDAKTTLAYNAIIRTAFSHDICTKALTLFNDLVLISEDGGMDDDPQ